MSLVNDLRREITRGINTLRRRHGNTADESEKETIMKSIEDLNDQLALLNQAALLDSASAVAAATDAVEGAIAAAKTGPFDGYLAAMEDHFNSLQALAGDLHAGERLPAAVPDEPPAARVPATPGGRSSKAKSKGASTRAPRRGRKADAAPSPAPAAPAPSPAPAPAVATPSPAPAAAAPSGLRPPLSLTEFAGLKDEYQVYFDACLARPEHKGGIAFCRSRLEKGRPTYEEVGASLGGIPWAFIGIIHGMECSFNFAGHLHNGDPLTARTVQVPPGRPRTGSPPFTWRQSASDALAMKGFDRVTDWSVPHMLFLLESYNGFGYRSRGVPSPYLWSFSNLYEKGKFVADRVFDPEAVSKQCGAAVMLKAVLTA